MSTPPDAKAVGILNDYGEGLLNCWDVMDSAFDMGWIDPEYTEQLDRTLQRAVHFLKTGEQDESDDPNFPDEVCPC